MFAPASLLTPLPGDSPCGPNLEYAPAFLQLEAAVCGRDEQRIGHSIRAAVEPDWQAVRALSLALFSHTKDLRVAVYLLRAELQLDGLRGLACGLQLIAGLLREYEYAIHPLKDANEYYYDYTMWPLESLDSAGPVLADLRSMYFGDSRNGVTGRSIELACDSTLQIEGKVVPTVDEIHLALLQEERRFPELLRYLGEARDAARTIDERIFEHYGYHTAINLGGLRRFINLLLDTMQHVLEQRDPPEQTAGITSGLPQHDSFVDIESEPLRTLDLKVLMAPIDDTEPCGPNLEYDPQFLQLEQSALPREERQIGETVVPAHEPDWRSVYALSLALFSRTKDLRVAVHLLRAVTRLNGIEGAAAGLKLIHTLLKLHWRDVHPTLDSDNNDPTMRLNVLASLADASTFLGDLRSLSFSDPSITGRLIELAQGDLQPGETECVPPEATIRRALRAEAKRKPTLLLRAREAQDAALAIESALAGHVGDMATVLQPLQRFMQCMIGVTQRMLDQEDARQDGDSGVALESAAPESRQDPMRVLEQVYAWIDQAPFDVPHECRRLKRLTTTRFIDIARDVVPDSVYRVEEFFGRAGG